LTLSQFDKLAKVAKGSTKIIDRCIDMLSDTDDRESLLVCSLFLAPTIENIMKGKDLILKTHLEKQLMTAYQDSHGESNRTMISLIWTLLKDHASREARKAGAIPSIEGVPRDVLVDEDSLFEDGVLKARFLFFESSRGSMMGLERLMLKSGYDMVEKSKGEVKLRKTKTFHGGRSVEATLSIFDPLNPPDAVNESVVALRGHSYEIPYLWISSLYFSRLSSHCSLRRSAYGKCGRCMPKWWTHRALVI